MSPRGAKGRVALVTGGSRGIGRAIAMRLAADGARVAIGYRRDAPAAEAVVEEIHAEGGTAAAFQATIGDRAEEEQLVADVLERFDRVDILVSNAGIASSGRAFAATTAAEVERLLTIHAVGAFNLCRLLVPQMRTQRRGDVVLISSVSTDLLLPGHGPYAMAKAALEALATVLAREEAAAGIRVNVIAPGLVATDMGDHLVRALTQEATGDVKALDDRFPFGRCTRPEDIAAAVSYLVSDDAASVTGARLVIDAGLGNDGVLPA